MDNTCKPIGSTIPNPIIADDIDRYGDDDGPVVSPVTSVLDALARARRKPLDQHIIDTFREAFDKAFLPVTPARSSLESGPEYESKPALCRL